jgi:Ni/Co efflux regulator RcnB
MRLVAGLVVALAVLIPATVLAQGASGMIDDSQRDLIKNFFADQAEKSKPADDGKAKDAKKSGKKTDKKKIPEKPKKPKKPKESKKDTKKDAKKDAKSAKNGKGKGKDKDKAKAAQAQPAAARTRIEPGAILPPDLPRRALPKGLDSKLPKPAGGQQRVIVGNDIVLIEKKSGRILDVVENAARAGR